MIFHYKYSCFNKYKTVYVFVFCNSLNECNKHKMMSHILKLVITDVTNNPQLLYSSVIVYVIEFYSIHCTKSHFNTVPYSAQPLCWSGWETGVRTLAHSDSCSLYNCSPSKWKSAHLLTSEFLIRKKWICNKQIKGFLIQKFIF